MIEIDDADVPPGATALTIPEIMECFRDGTADVRRGDLIFEWRDPQTGGVVGRKWVWKDGTAVGEGAYDFTHWIGRALWYARPERLN